MMTKTEIWGVLHINTECRKMCASIEDKNCYSCPRYLVDRYCIYFLDSLFSFSKRLRFSLVFLFWLARYLLNPHFTLQLDIFVC